MTNTIPCQTCKPDDGKGCHRCGGYKSMLIKGKCKCGQEYWDLPGSKAFYDGDTFESFDGLKITCYADKPWTCARCE